MEMLITSVMHQVQMFCPEKPLRAIGDWTETEQWDERGDSELSEKPKATAGLAWLRYRNPDAI